MPAREERCSIAGGRLDAEQAVVWDGGWPDRPPAALLDLMERLHWRTVARYGCGMVRVRRGEGVVSCDALGGVPMLVFERNGERVEPRSVERRWRIAAGVLVRPVAPDAWTRGAFALGLGGQDGRLRAWVRVEAFPSRFLLTGGGWLGDVLAGLYSRFHARVSFAYLEALRRQLSETTTRPSTPA
jgi:hypothetical protein